MPMFSGSAVHGTCSMIRHVTRHSQESLLALPRKIIFFALPFVSYHMHVVCDPPAVEYIHKAENVVFDSDFD